MFRREGEEKFHIYLMISEWVAHLFLDGNILDLYYIATKTETLLLFGQYSLHCLDSLIYTLISNLSRQI